MRRVLLVASASPTEQNIARFAGGRNQESFMTQRPPNQLHQAALYTTHKHETTNQHPEIQTPRQKASRP